MTDCGICGGRASRTLEGLEGYRAGLFYDVFACGACGASFARPPEPRPELYEWIYRHAARLPGYQRYAGYASRIRAQARPLDWLATREEAYWAVREVLAGAGRVLDLGCGLGYLTWALAQAGADARGVDPSREAVEAARARFGPLFDAADPAALPAESADLVLLLEAVEHDPDPVGILDACRKLLRPGGRILVTTPDKAAAAPDRPWETELPPVHLWWLTRASLEAAARRLSLGISFLDFSAFYREVRVYDHVPVLAVPAFDREGDVLLPPAGGRVLPFVKRVLESAGLLEAARAARQALAGHRRIRARGGTIGAVLTRGG